MVLYVFMLLPLMFIVDLNWGMYLRLAIIGLGWLYLTYSDFLTHQSKEKDQVHRFKSILIVLGLLFIVSQFDPGILTYSFLAPYTWLFRGFVFLLVGIPFVQLMMNRSAIEFKISLVDYAVIGTASIVLLLFGLSVLLFDRAFDGFVVIQVMMFVMMWFWVTRWLPRYDVLEKRLLKGVPIVFLGIGVVGGGRIATAYYHFYAGAKAQQAGQFETALEHIDYAVRSGQQLSLNELGDSALFEKAATLYKSGNSKGAATTLSMTEDFVFQIPKDTWEGPAGGMLYTNINCWKDLTLFDGRIRIKIFARGDAALGIWPRMRVKLGNKLLGEIDVDTPEIQPYTFDVTVERARQRLDIAFTNDYFAPPENRNLWIEHAEVQYLEMAWK